MESSGGRDASNVAVEGGLAGVVEFETSAATVEKPFELLDKIRGTNLRYVTIRFMI